MKRNLLALAMLLASPSAMAETLDGNRIVVIDGDTIGLPCAKPEAGCSERIRFIDIDAPESWRSHCEDEHKAGLEAKARVAALIRGQQVEVHRSGRQDRYRRTLANVSVPAGDVGAILLREGLARPYKPGRQAHWDRVTWWCGPGDW